MPLRNDRGTAVDPVPFVVVGSIAALASYAFGVVYLVSLGLGFDAALACCTAVAATAVAWAYHRFVKMARPASRAAVPGPVRFQRIVLTAVAGVALLVLLWLPVLVP